MVFFSSSDPFDLTDEILCAHAKQDERVAIEALIRRYSRMVRALTRPYYLAGAGEEDLVQEGMLGLLKAVREYNEQSKTPFRAFAEVCVRNHIIAAIRSAGRKKHQPLNSYISFGEPLFKDNADAEIALSTISDPEVLVMEKEANAELDKVLQGLLSTFEAKVLRCFLSGYTYSEIAAALKKPLKSVDNAVTRIRRKLTAYYNFIGDSR